MKNENKIVSYGIVKWNSYGQYRKHKLYLQAVQLLVYTWQIAHLNWWSSSSSTDQFCNYKVSVHIHIYREIMVGLHEQNRLMYKLCPVNICYCCYFWIFVCRYLNIHIDCRYLNIHIVCRYLNIHIVCRYLNKHIVYRYLNIHIVCRYSNIHIVCRYLNIHIVYRYLNIHTVLCFP